jgi:hypothetical protein
MPLEHLGFVGVAVGVLGQQDPTVADDHDAIAHC